MVTVRLDPDELEYVRGVAEEVTTRRMGAPEPAMAHKRTPEQNFDYTYRAFAAEYAVAKYLDQPWLENYGGPAGFDVAPNIEVRNTVPNRQLYIKARELHAGPYSKPPHTRYVLTYSTEPDTVTLIGYITAGDAVKCINPYKPSNGAILGYLIGREYLLPITELRELLAVDHGR